MRDSRSSTRRRVRRFRSLLPLMRAGHDGFLLEFKRLNELILGHLRDRLPSIYAAAPLVKAPLDAGPDQPRDSVFGEAEAEGADVSRW